MVTIQITPQSAPSPPSWLGEVAAFAQVLTYTGLLKTIQDEVRFARARFGCYDLIDFGAVLIGYILSDEPTLLAFYERLAPFASPFMALFGRDQCLIAPPCPDFWRLSTSPRWRRFARSFTRICWPASHSLLSVVCLTEQAGSGW